ncbi:MAG TPA: lipid II flippase MurJ [Streptosporangiaceae bacterium]|nr:lipid II flippase MurJ [Streptosporangiaceae bacterium]
MRTSVGKSVAESATVTGAATSRLRRDATGIARGAAVIASLTILARILGLARTLVFSQAVGATCLGTAYVTANQVPNLIQELVLGGALTSAMIPVLARSAERSATDPAEKAMVSRISSALITWTIVILVPLTIIIAALAGPIAALLNPANANSHCPHADMVATTATMLRVFSPQALLYGLSIVLTGMLQAYRRFAGAALAPAVSSLVLIACYLAFAPMGKGLPLGRLPLSAQLVLSVGTTAGIAALVVVVVLPTWRLHLRLRPELRFPPGVARRAGGLAMVGVVEIIATNAAAVVVIALANGRGPTGALVIYNYASQVFATLNAVLVLSITLSAFPVLASRDGPALDRACAGSTRAVVLAACLGTAVIAAISVPAAHVLAKQPSQVPQLILTFAMYAPGLIGLAVIGNLSRVMMAIGRLKVAALAVGGGSVLAMVVEVVLVELVPARLVVPALGLGNTIAQTAVAIPLVVVTRRIRGAAAVQGIGRATAAGLAAAAGGAAIGAAVSIALPAGHKLLDAVVATLAAVCAGVTFTAVAFVFNRGETAVLLARLRQVAGRWVPRWAPAPVAGAPSADASGDDASGTGTAVNGAGASVMTGAVHEPAQHPGNGARPYQNQAMAYRNLAMAMLGELGYPVEISRPDPGYAVAAIKKGRRVAIVFRHDSQPLTFAMITQVLASARPPGIPTLLMANQPVTLAAAELAADTGSFEIVHWTGQYENDELVRRLTSLATARHRR